MYSAPYGYANPAGGQPFNGAPQQQNPHMQPGPSPGQPQQMMYNPQQFPMGGQPGHFPPGPNPSMMGPGPAGMMQNAAMPHMAANGQMAYQTPYTSSPYGPGLPSAAAPQVQLPGNYMMAGGMAPYQMNPGMPQQQPQQSMMPRMHPAQNQQNMSVATPQRPFNPAQGTPGNPMTSQAPQFSTPQAHAPPPQSQTPTNAHQPPSAAATPQTPTFPPTGQQQQTNGTSTVSTPQSPVSDSRDKERFALLLDINQELLYESVTLFNSKTEVKKAQAAVEAGTLAPEGNLSEEEKILTQDYTQCMRRIQVNLTYLAALADRKSVHPPAPPAVLMPPPLNLGLKLRVSSDESPEKMPDPNADREERDRLMKHLYSKLQALFPGVDPKKEGPPAGSNPRPSNAQQMNPNQQNPQQQNPQQQNPHQQNPNQQMQQQMQQQNPNQQMQHNMNQHMLQMQMQQQMQTQQMPGKAPPNGQMMGPGGHGSDHGSPAPGSHGQKTPQMSNASAPPMHA